MGRGWGSCGTSERGRKVDEDEDQDSKVCLCACGMFARERGSSVREKVCLCLFLYLYLYLYLHLYLHLYLYLATRNYPDVRVAGRVAWDRMYFCVFSTFFLCLFGVFRLCVYLTGGGSVFCRDIVDTAPLREDSGDLPPPWARDSFGEGVREVEDRLDMNKAPVMAAQVGKMQAHTQMFRSFIYLCLSFSLYL